MSRVAFFWSRLRHALLAPIPPECRESFFRHTAYRNWLHATCLAAIVAAINTLIGLIPEFFYYRSGFWPADALHLSLTLLHGFMLVCSVGAFVWLYRTRPAAPDLATCQHQRIALGYGCLMLAAVTAFSVIEQRLTGSISAYLLGLAAFATLLYTTPHFSLLVVLLSFSALLGGALRVSGDTPVTWHHLIVGFDAVVIFWITSRVMFSLRVAHHLHLVTIEQQSRDLAASNARLARAEEFKTDLLNVAAHDLRDPLNTISLSAQILRDELPARSELQSLALTINDSALHLSEFVHNLLTDLTSETHHLQLERTPTDLPRFIDEIAAAFQPLATRKSITLHITADATALAAPPAQLDRARFRQVVENLVTNAIKFSPPGKGVWITLAHTTSEGHRLTVRDEGPGLTPADHERLFNKYQRLSARPTAGEHSTGLGLFIVRNLVTLHGGRVWAESAGPGRGVTFIVTLP